jgi:hypothetical protein
METSKAGRKYRLDVIKAALETFKNDGFWVANKTKKGFELSRQKLSNEKYEAYKKALEQKDNNANWIKNDQK